MNAMASKPVEYYLIPPTLCSSSRRQGRNIVPVAPGASVLEHRGFAVPAAKLEIRKKVVNWKH